MTDTRELLQRRLREAQATFAGLDAGFLDAVEAAAALAIETLKAGGGVYLLGNAGRPPPPRPALDRRARRSLPE